MDHRMNREAAHDGGHLARTAAVLLALMVCLLLVQAAAANADVMAMHKAAYKSKLNYYRNQMDFETDSFFTAWRQATEAHITRISTALADPEQAQYVPQYEQFALSDRSLLQQDVAKYRNKIYANIAAFKATAVDWFKARADKDRFKTRLAIMRGGFVQIFSADESLMKALAAIGINADVGGANNELFAADATRITAETTFDKGWTQLRALQ